MRMAFLNSTGPCRQILRVHRPNHGRGSTATAADFMKTVGQTKQLLDAGN